MTTASLDGALWPQLFFERTRMKYVPAGTPVVMYVVAGEFRPVTAMSERPVAVPASST